MRMRLLPTVCLVLAAAGCVKPSRTGHPGKAPRVLLMGIDGGDMKIVDRLIAAGKLPTFALLKKEGASGLLASRPPILSPLVWTTIATGRKAQDHGVLDFVEVASDGNVVPIESSRRKVPALWDLATDYGKSAGFIGWYASYPAEKVSGFVVSDRMAFHQVKSARATQGATYPESLAAEIRKTIGDPRPDVAATRARFLSDASATISADGEKRLEQLAKIYATSEFYRKLTPALSSRFGTDIVAVYFEGIDACGHLFMEDASPRRAEVTDGDYRAFSNTVDLYYEYQDEVLADLLKLEGPDTVTIICSDHGFKAGSMRPHTSGRADTGLAPLWHEIHGVVFVHGKGARAGATIEDASVLDIMPTASALLGLPLSKELPGHVLASAFAKDAAPPTPRQIASYPPRPAAKRRAAVSDSQSSEAVEKLMALGYLTGGASKVPHDPEGRTASSYLNEGMALSVDRDDDAALRAYGRCIDLDPRSTLALVSASGIYTNKGDFTHARELLARAQVIQPDSINVDLASGRLALETGDNATAARMVAIAEKIDDQYPQLRLLRAKLENLAGKSDAALEDLNVAETLTDARREISEVLLLKIEILASKGRAAEARGLLPRLSANSPDNVTALAEGDVCTAEKNYAGAVRAYRRALEGTEGSLALSRKLADALKASGNLAEAEAVLRKAIPSCQSPAEIEGVYRDLALAVLETGGPPAEVAILRQGTAAAPKSGALWLLLGGALGNAGRMPEAFAAYEQSVALQPTALGCKTLALFYYSMRRDRGRAISLWRQSLSLDPNQPDVRAFLARSGPAPPPGS